MYFCAFDIKSSESLTVVGKKRLVLNCFRAMEQAYVPKNKMKDIRVMSGT